MIEKLEHENLTLKAQNDALKKQHVELTLRLASYRESAISN